MKKLDVEQIIYFKDILVDYLKTENISLPEVEIALRSQLAALELERDDLTTSQVLESALDVLFNGYTYSALQVS